MKVRQRFWRTTKGTRRVAWGFVGMGRDGRQVRVFRDEWTKEDAEREAAKHLLQVEQPEEVPPPPSMTLGEAATRYITAKSRKKSLPEDQRLLKHLKLYFGADTPLTEITAARIAAYRDERLAATSIRRKDANGQARKLSLASVNRPLALLRHLLKLAHEEWGVLPTLPRIRTLRGEQPRLRWLTPEEAQRLLGATKGDLRDIVELILFTGLRRGEALALDWAHVDRARGVILVPTSKSGKRREVPLCGPADAVLERRGPGEAGLVFPGGWDRYRGAWERAVRAAKLVDVRLHDLRHTFASWAVQRGVSLPEVKELLGHATITMSLRYSHLAPEHLRSAVARLDGVLGADTHVTHTPAPITSPVREAAALKSSP